MQATRGETGRRRGDRVARLGQARRLSAARSRRRRRAPPGCRTGAGPRGRSVSRRHRSPSWLDQRGGRQRRSPLRVRGRFHAASAHAPLRCRPGGDARHARARVREVAPPPRHSGPCARRRVARRARTRRRAPGERDLRQPLRRRVRQRAGRTTRRLRRRAVGRAGGRRRGARRAAPSADRRHAADRRQRRRAGAAARRAFASIARTPSSTP